MPPACVPRRPSTISSILAHGIANAISWSWVCPKMRSPEHGRMTWASPVCIVVSTMSAQTARPSKEECRRPARFLGFRVHALAERADVVDRQRLVEADGGDAERADVVLARERDHPPVPARHVDHLARHAELLEVSRGTLRPLGDGLAGPEHADRHGEGLRADIGGELLVRRLDVDHFWKPPVRSLGAVSTFVKQARVFSVECGTLAMARYRIVHWKEIPSVVEAADGD